VSVEKKDENSRKVLVQPLPKFFDENVFCSTELPRKINAKSMLDFFDFYQAFLLTTRLNERV